MVSWSQKFTWHRLSQVVRVYAALRGINKGNNNMTSYNLIVKFKNGQTLKILETKNASKIRRELVCLRKFLELEDEVMAIYDETRKVNYNKTTNRLKGMPDETQKIDSKGQPVYSDSSEDEIELVSPAATMSRQDSAQS